MEIGVQQQKRKFQKNIIPKWVSEIITYKVDYPDLFVNTNFALSSTSVLTDSTIKVLLSECLSRIEVAEGEFWLEKVMQYGPETAKTRNNNNRIRSKTNKDGNTIRLKK